MAYIFRILCIGFIASSLLSCDKRELVAGYIEGLTNDTLLVSIASMSNLGAEITQDTLVAVEGHFMLYPPKDSSYNSIIYIYPLQADRYIAGQTYRPQSMVMTMISERGKPLELHANIKKTGWVEYYVTGKKESQDNSILSRVNNSLKPLESQIAYLDHKIGEFYSRPIEKSTLDSLTSLRRVVMADITSLKCDAVLRNPSSMASGYLITQTPYDFAYDNYERISESVRNSMLKPLLDRYINEVMTHVTTSLNATNLEIGMPAPNFTLPQDDSTNFELSSLRGRYVVLNFWASWSEWCTNEFSDMENFYLRNWRAVEFVGIGCQESQQEWLDGLDKWQLPWVNVRNKEQDVDENVAAMYGVSALPTKIIINPEGLVVGRIVGNEANLYQVLKQIVEQEQN